MRYILYFLISISSFAVVTAQQYEKKKLCFIADKEGKLLAVPVFSLPEQIDIPKTTYKLYTPSNPLIERMKFKMKDFEVPVLPDWHDRPMDMNVLSGAYMPFFNEYTAMLRRVSPMALDFDEYEIYPVGVNAGLMLNGRQFSWPGFGGTTTAQASLLWSSERMTVSGGVFAGRYYSPYAVSPGFLGGVNATAKYEVTDWLALRAWGQYTYSDNKGKDAFLQMNPLLNQTNIGGSVEFKVGDNVGFGVGVNYQHNTFNGCFEPQYLIYPTMTGRRMRVGFGGL